MTGGASSEPPPPGPDLLTGLYADFPFEDGPWNNDVGPFETFDSEGQYSLGISAYTVGSGAGVIGDSAQFTPQDDGNQTGGGFANVFAFGTEDVFSFELWIDALSATGNGSALFGSIAGGDSWYVNYDNSAGFSGLRLVAFGDGTVTNIANKDDSTSPGWHQIVVTFSGTTIQTYFDGLPVASDPITAPKPGNNINLFEPSTTQAANASMNADNLRFWTNRVLNQEDVTWLWNDGDSRTYQEIVDSGGEVTPLTFGISGTNFVSPVTFFANWVLPFLGLGLV